MIRALLLRQLRHQRWVLGGVVVGLLVFEVFLLQLAASFEGGPGIDQLLEMLPELVNRLVKSQISTASFPAFVAFGFMHPAVLTTSLAVMILLATTPAGEREGGQLELFLARPMARGTYLRAHLLSLVVAAVVMPLIVLAGVAVGLATIEVQNELPWWRYAPCALGLATLLLAVGCFALWVSVGARRRGTAVARIVSLLLVAYVGDTAAKFSELLGPLRWLTPFQYFDPIGTALEPPLPWWQPVVLLTGGLVFAVLAFRRFETRDL